MKFDLLEIGGLQSALKAMRYPTKTEGDTFITDRTFVAGEKDTKLIKHLLNKTEELDGKEIFQGDTHGKFQRGIIAWFDIDMPRYIWSELDTYTIGMTPMSSESTMYTLLKESKHITKSMFSEYTPMSMINAFKETITSLKYEYGDIKNIPINIIKAALPEGWMQGRIRAFSYQTLRRIYLQRHNHRLDEWHFICDNIKLLPHADLLIFGKDK
jgi:hypothetical protein